jgi:hypothetical protein
MTRFLDMIKQTFWTIAHSSHAETNFEHEILASEMAAPKLEIVIAINHKNSCFTCIDCLILLKQILL